MKTMKFVSSYFLILFLSFLAISSIAQDSSTLTSEGTDFIFSFSPNNSTPTKLTLFISSKVTATGVVDIPRLGTKIPFTTSPGTVTSLAIPVSMAALPTGVKSTYGINVISDSPVSVYALNQLNNTTDAFLVLPTHALGKVYYAATYNGYSGSAPSQIAIVGTRDNTQIRISPSVGTTTGSAKAVQTITLNRMETFLLSATSFSDLTGTSIEADAPVAVTSGAKCANVPINAVACDHLVEMIPPLSAWGSAFISYPLATRLKGDLIRVMSSMDNTEVKFNGAIVATLAKGTYYDLISKDANIIETSNPTLVIQYSLGQSYDSVLSDPFMMLIPPTEQLLDAYTFSTPTSGFNSNFVNVIIRTSGLDTLIFDGVRLDPTLFKPIGDGSFHGAKIPITPGSHSISADAKIGLYVYGFGNYDSYGYPGGMATEIINSITGDYKNVKVISTLGTKEIDIDPSSFTLQPKEVRQANGVTQIEWFFPEFSIGQVKNLDFEVIAKNLAPGERRVVTNSLEMTYQDLNGVEHKRLLGEQVLDVLSSGFALGVSTDKQTYGANEAVTISTDVSNIGDAQALVTVLSEIRDENDTVVASVSTPPAFVLVGKSTIQLSPTEFLTGSTYAGSYHVYSKLIDVQGKLLAEASAAFSIAAQQALTASITATTDKYSYTTKDTAVIEAFVKNLTENRFIEDVTARVRILAPDNSVHWSQSTPITQIAAGNDELVRGQVPLVDAIPGAYILESSLINTDGEVIASYQSNFTVVDSPLFVIEGHVSVDSAEIGTGEVASCTYTVTNIGGSLIPEQKISVNLVRVDEPDALLTQEQIIRFDAGASTTLSPELPAIQQAGSYACVLEAISDGATKMLGSALFTVVTKESPIKLAGDIQVGEKARLLVLMDDSTTERAYLENLLTNAGWFYTIVTSAGEFELQLRSGGYGAYALLSERITLSSHSQAALKLKVAEGDGLIVAGATDRRHQTLEQVLGINARANEAYAKGITIQDSELGLAWEHSFNQSARVLSFAANGATVIGEYSNNLPGADSQTPLGALGAAGRYGNFVWDDFTSLSSAIEGRIAVGGNLNLQHFSVGDKLDPNTLHDVVTVGGDVTFPSGRIYYGNLIAGGSVSGVGDPVRFGMAPGAVISGNAAVPLNFDGEREYLQELSTTLATLPANGTVQMQWGGMELKGDCTSSSQIFNVNSADLGVAHTFAVSCIPADATVVFNVTGQSVTLKNMGMQSLTAIRDKVLFNFPQATSLSMSSIGIEGSILAPFAQVDQPAGRIDGQVIVKSWYSTNWGYMSIHNRFFGGDLSAAASQTSKNALAIYQYQQGKSIFAGFDVLAQATALGVSSENPFAQLLLSALEQVNPVPITARAGKVVPVVLTYENTGAQTATGQVKLTLAGTITLLNSAAFTQLANSSDWVLPLNLNAGASNSQIIYVQLPASGAPKITLQLQTGTSPDWATRLEKALNFNLQ